MILLSGWNSSDCVHDGTIHEFRDGRLDIQIRLTGPEVAFVLFSSFGPIRASEVEERRCVTLVVTQVLELRTSPSL